MSDTTFASVRRVLWCGLVLLGGQKLCSAGNFDVCGVPTDRARVIAIRAERTLERVSAMLHEDERPTPWRLPCQIHVHRSSASFARAVGGPPGNALGATSIEFEGDTVSLRRIDVLDDTPAGVPSAIAHEIVHVALADHFTESPPPRWADEGIAVLFDDESKQRGHDNDFHEARRAGLTWSVAHLMALPDYPREDHRQRVFYGQSASLVRWLLERRDGATLLAFLDDAAALGESVALERHYGFESLAALERAWLASPSAMDVAGD